MPQRWVIHKKSDGSALTIGHMTADAATPPSAANYDGWNGTTMAAVSIDSYDPASQIWDAATLTLIDELTIPKAMAAERVNTEAEAFRMRFLTSGAGQAATYLKKETEARAWVSGADPATAPFLACEAENTSMTIDAVAALVIAQADAWIYMGSQIEGLRRGAAVAIDAATTPAEIAAAATVNWTSLLP